MERIPPMVDMRRTPAEKTETLDASPINAVADYPYGLAISLCSDDLDKLGITDLPEVGYMLHIHGLAKVTGVSSNETSAGANRRVELQITHMVAEDEDDENGDDEAQEPVSPKVAQRRLYR